MYIPKRYSEQEWEQTAYLIKKYPLGTVVTTTETGEIIANHIPFFLKIDPDTGKKSLIAHVAKSNPQVPSLTANDRVLVIFQSTDTYITPSYYPGKPETQKYVPTWDFAAAHIYGPSRIIDDFDFVRDQITLLTNQSEEGKAVPWKVTDAPERYLNAMQRAITGLEIDIVDSECKYKFEQTMSKRDAEGVVEGLEKDGLLELSQLTREARARLAEKVKGA